jgi:hypothetical protein
MSSEQLQHSQQIDFCIMPTIIPDVAVFYQLSGRLMEEKKVLEGELEEMRRLACIKESEFEGRKH